MDILLNKLRTKNFSFTGSNCTEKEIIKKGRVQLLGTELYTKIVNKTVFGDYPMGYIFVANIFENGKTECVNNVGSTDIGNWKIDFEKHTLQIKWQNRWINTITRAYEVNGNIEF